MKLMHTMKLMHNFVKIEPMMANRAIIGPKLASIFPHLASEAGTWDAHTIGTHSSTAAAVAVADIAGTDTAAFSVGAYDAEVHFSSATSSNEHDPTIREGPMTNINAAVLADAGAPLAAAGAAADADAAIGDKKRRSKPFRIPKG